MPAAMPPTPATVLATLLRNDPAAPRLTCYDDGTGERIELSAKTLANWAHKAANLLQEDADAMPGSTVGLDLPAHWRALYWALATWLAGAAVVVGPEAAEADVVVTDDPQVAARAADDGRYAVLVTLAALARAHPDLPPGVVDEAKELSGYGDGFDPAATPRGEDLALRICGADADGPEAAGGRVDTAYRQVVPAAGHPPGSRVRLPDDLPAVLRGALRAWAADGSIVLVRDARGDQRARLAAERVSVDLGGPDT